MDRKGIDKEKVPEIKKGQKMYVDVFLYLSFCLFLAKKEKEKHL
jgi:hypothetical protein